MAKNLKRLCALVMALVMCGGMFCTTASAATLENGHVWNGEGLSMTVAAGTAPYTFMSVYRSPANAYEMSYHMLSANGGVNNDIPQTLMMIDASKDYTWTPSAPYAYGASNYEVLYCCDAETGYKDAIYYKRANLEDSDYYTADQAAKIRAIVTNAYPFVTLDAMKADLKENGFADADALTRADVISAVQAAIWAFSNETGYKYSQTFDVPTNTQWGTVMNDYDSEMTADWMPTGKRKFATDETTGARINALTQHLLAQDKVYADKAQIVITKLELNGTPAKISDTQAQIPLVLELNNSGSGYEDNINVTIKCDGEVVKTFPVELGVEKYTLNIVTGLQTKITAEVSGTQVLPAGVYFYAPEGGRDVSQSLVGVAMGATPVYAYDEMDLSIMDIPNLPNNPPAGDVIIPEPPVNKDADGLDDEDQTNVTLTVGGETAAPVDIVIALGAGIAREDNTRESMKNLIQPLVEAGVPVKLGLVAVEHYTDVAMKLTALTADNYENVIDSGLATIKSLPAGPTNLHSNIETAKAMLDADKAVEAENKYFYVIATGRTYNYDNEYGAPTTIINKLSHNGNTYYYWGHYLWQSQRGQHTSLYMIPDRYNDNFAAYWADVEKWVAADGDTYAYTFPIASYNDPQWFNNYMAENGSDLKAHGIASSRYGWLITELTNSGTAAIGSGTNPQNALNYERAQYEAYQTYQEMKAAGYNCYALCSESTSYQNGSPYIKQVAKYTGTSTIQLGHSFMNFLAGEEQDYTAPILFQLTDDSGNYDMATNFFNAIEPNAGTVTVASGSYVEDFIGKNENGNFEFIQDASVITLNVGGVDYVTAQIDTKEDADSSYSFTARGASEPTFWLDYYYGDGETTERFIWTFGEDVNGVITLTYKLQLIGKQEAEGSYIVPTNNSATLHPAGGKEQEFPVPEVGYVVKKEIITPPDPMEMGGQKTSEKVEENRFEITINVPGKDGDNRHDEVILMVDGSYSMDNEWPAMKDAINAIGETVLNGNGNTQLTLMAFGMGDNIVLKHVKSADELANALGELPGNLLYGRSSTNCESGFTGVEEYIRNHDNTLHEVQVIFISDGNLNTDETPRAFDTNWKNWATAFGALTVAQVGVEETILYGTKLPAAFNAVFGDRFAGLSGTALLDKVFGGAVTNDEFIAFADQVWADVYAYSNLVPGKEYPVSDVERAFVKYDKENGTYIQDIFYYTTYKSSYVTYGNRWTRTPAAAEELAKLGNVAKMYVVDYDSYTAWMDTGITSDKSIFVQSNGIAGLCDALAGALTDLSKAPFSDVVVTDYMSKWVDLDASTLKIVNNATGETIWTAAGGWKITENRPTAQEVPVVVELVDPADYAAGGKDVIDNTNGDIYKLTWYVKDGAMLRADTYALKYEVNVDTAEEGFVDNTKYPANGTTNLTYKDEDRNEQTNEIKVPDVEGVKPVPEIPEIPTVSFKNGDASNISFMLLDPATGKVEFLVKYDIGSETTYEIPTAEGKISAVFIKQSTSGMFWFSQEVGEDLQQAVIDCLKANNPSYKGHNAVAFGEGDHELEFKKGKFVTYTFAGAIADVAGKVETTPVETTPTETVPTDTTAPSEPENKPTEPETKPTEPETKPTEPENKPTEPEAPKAEAPKGELTVKVDGGKVKNWTVINGVTGIYIEANGKIPAVLWTSVKVEGAALEAFIEALGADAEAEVIYDFGPHTIEYQQNKNKTKTVTFTFTNLAEPEVAVVAETEAPTEPEVEETEAATEAATEPVVEETEPEVVVEETESVVEETEPEVEETEPEVEETKSNGKDKKNKKNK